MCGVLAGERGTVAEELDPQLGDVYVPQHGVRTRRHVGGDVSLRHVTTPAAQRGVLSRVTPTISHATDTYFLSRGAIHVGLSNQTKVLLLGEGHVFFFLG